MLTAFTRQRRGMTLLEVVVGLIILSLLGAVLVPQFVQRQRDGMAAAIASNITAVRAAALEFRKATGRYPSQILQLTTQPVSGTSLDLCGRTMVVDFATLWRGPYLQQAVTTAGVPIRDAIVQNTIRRNPTTLAGGVIAELLIDVTNVDQTVANVLETSLDSGASLTTGTIRWVAVGSTGQGTLTLSMPVRGC